MGTRPLPFPEQPKSPVVERRLANLEKRSLTRPQIDQQSFYDDTTPRFSTIVVAPYNSNLRGIMSPDILLSGADDQLLLAEAYGEIASSSWGLGEVLLLDGLVNVSGQIDSPSGIATTAVGRRSTTIAAVGVAADYDDNATGTAAVFRAEGKVNVTLRNMRIDAPNGASAVYVQGGSGCRLDSVHLNGSGTASGSALLAQEHADLDVIDSSTFQGMRGIELLECTDPLLRDVRSTQAILQAFLLDSWNNPCLRAELVACRANLAGREGILLADTIDCSVIGGHVYSCSQQTDNTYDGIRLRSGSLRNNVEGVTVRKKASANRHRYGAIVETGATDNRVICDLLDGGQTANFSDAGTGTVTTGGNRT